MEHLKLYKIMSLGYNVNIECKGKGRVYEMTYEANANKILPKNATNEDWVNSIKNYHSVGNSIEEVTSNIYDQIMKDFVS